MENPNCCGKGMKFIVETPFYSEFRCGECKDVVYVKKGATPRPQMIDD